MTWGSGALIATQAQELFTFHAKKLHETQDFE
jgi:hypothetical protein